jgi:light-regulated signal transduction histidine kinase (bacteriophytochrome)
VISQFMSKTASSDPLDRLSSRERQANNAIKFTDRGKVVIGLAQRRDPDHTVIELSVSDTGCGIKPEDQARLFQAFTQLDSLPTHRFEGTGLGLYLSQKLAGLLGARITCESESGRGSVFTLQLEQPDSPQESGLPSNPTIEQAALFFSDEPEQCLSATLA